MAATIYPLPALDRSTARWEDQLHVLTPTERCSGVWFKREDRFAPLGYGGPNGSKLRQLIWLVARGRTQGAETLVSGASVKSPQLSMSAVVARHFGMTSLIIIGATTPTAAIRNLNVQIAARFGAKFHIAPVGYNPYLQREVARRAVAPECLAVEYGITLDHRRNPAADVVAFHELGANQIQNLPEVEELIVPAGSCNTLVSVLYGIGKYRPRFKRLFTLGVGPDKLAWVHDRLRVIEEETGRRYNRLFQRRFPQFPEEEAKGGPAGAPYTWEHWNLQTAGFSTYTEEVRESWGDIIFHPTYEAKMIKWLKKNRPLRRDGSQAFWIVGSEPKLEVISLYAPLGPQEVVSCLE